VLLKFAVVIRAAFSWWGAWGPAIGIGDCGRGCPPPPKKKNPGKIFSVEHNVKFWHFLANVVYRIQEFCYFFGQM